MARETVKKGIGNDKETARKWYRNVLEAVKEHWGSQLQYDGSAKEMWKETKKNEKETGKQWKRKRNDGERNDEDTVKKRRQNQ